MRRFNGFVPAGALSLAVALAVLVGCRDGQKPMEQGQKPMQQDQITQRLNELKNPMQQDQITQKLNEFKDPDKAVRSRAGHDLTKIPVKPERRDEVAQAINGLLEDADADVRYAGIRAAMYWGTKRHNEAALTKLIRSTDLRETQESRTARARLAP